jgi:hypothetical protein
MQPPMGVKPRSRRHFSAFNDQDPLPSLVLCLLIESDYQAVGGGKINASRTNFADFGGSQALYQPAVHRELTNRRSPPPRADHGLSESLTAIRKPCESDLVASRGRPRVACHRPAFAISLRQKASADKGYGGQPRSNLASRWLASPPSLLRSYGGHGFGLTASARLRHAKPVGRSVVGDDGIEPPTFRV